MLVRLDENGLNHFVLYENRKIKIDYLALDHYERNVYWIERYFDPEIMYVNLNGGEVKKFKINGNFDYVLSIREAHLEVDEKYVYFTAKIKQNDLNYYLLRANKSSGEYDQDFGISGFYLIKENSYEMTVFLSDFKFLNN